MAPAPPGAANALGTRGPTEEKRSFRQKLSIHYHSLADALEGFAVVYLLTLVSVRIVKILM